MDVLITPDRLFRNCSKCPADRVPKHTGTQGHKHTHTHMWPDRSCKPKNNNNKVLFSSFWCKLIPAIPITPLSYQIFLLILSKHLLCFVSSNFLHTVTPQSKPCCCISETFGAHFASKTPGLIETINLPDTEAKVLGRFCRFNINIKKIYLSKKKPSSKWNQIEMYVLNDKLSSCWINIIALLW